MTCVGTGIQRVRLFIEGDRMKALVILVFSLVLICSPVAAQPVTPAPDPPASSEWRILQELVQAVQGISASDNSTENSSAILIAVGFALLIIAVLVFFWKVAPPLLKQLADAGERERQNNELRVRWAESLERLSANMNEFSTRTDDKTRTDSAVEQVNKHTDAAEAPIVKAVDNILKLLTDDKAARDQRDNGFDKKLDEAIRELRQLKTAVMKGDTGPLDETKVPATDPKDAPHETP